MNPPVTLKGCKRDPARNVPEARGSNRSVSLSDQTCVVWPLNLAPSPPGAIVEGVAPNVSRKRLPQRARPRWHSPQPGCHTRRRHALRQPRQKPRSSATVAATAGNSFPVSARNNRASVRTEGTGDGGEARRGPRGSAGSANKRRGNARQPRVAATPAVTAAGSGARPISCRGQRRDKTHRAARAFPHPRASPHTVRINSPQ